MEQYTISYTHQEPSDAVAMWQFLPKFVESTHAAAAIVTEAMRLLNEEFIAASMAGAELNDAGTHLKLVGVWQAAIPAAKQSYRQVQYPPSPTKRREGRHKRLNRCVVYSRGSRATHLLS